MAKWIGVDLDGTLARYEGAMGNAIGAPVLPMLQRVKEWIEAGREVRIFTARACDPAQIPHVRAWLREHRIGELPITNVKDFDMTALYDDKAVRVKRNVGYVCGACYRMNKGRT